METKQHIAQHIARWGRVHGVREDYGIPDATIYRLIALGLIRSALIQRPGTKRGTRLVDLNSLDAYLATLAEAK